MSTEIADRVRALREALGLRPYQVAQRGGYSRGNAAYISKIERGDNNVSTIDARRKLARGFGLSVAQLEAYLEGRVPLAATVRLVRAPEAAEEVLEDDGPPPDPPHPEDEEVDPLEPALLWALDRERHSMRDLDAVRSVVRGTARMSAPGADLVHAARAWLDAAARLRKRGVAVTLESLLMEITLGSKTAAVSKSAAALQEDVEHEWASKAKKPVDTER